MQEKFKFEVNENDWNYVKEVGLPQDGTWCMVVWKDCAGSYAYDFGGYNGEENTFYVNFGYGGCVLEADLVVAWIELHTDADKFLKVM